MTRLQPTQSTVKKLFGLSGNVCAVPECKNRLIENGVVLGEICHIEAAELKGPRYNENSNDEYRRSFQNLMLLCEKCHKKVDAEQNVKQYPTTLLTLWKKEHEDRFQENEFKISDDLVKKSLEIFLANNNSNTGSGTQFNNQAILQHIDSQIGTQINNFGNSHDKGLEIEGYRTVDPELKKIIDKFRTKADPPKKAVIDFKDEIRQGKERTIELVPIKYLRFRKDNGRIRADVETLEKTLGKELEEHTKETQKQLRELLKALNPEDNNELKRLIKHKGQREPAIITCDGYLINGNRRKLVLEELYSESGQDSKYENMRVVILPDHVTELDIQKIENRYQLQSEGKSEYHGLNRALTLRKNIEKGFPLEAQLKDDPNFVDLEGKEFARAIKKIKKDFLDPLDCVDRYLDTFERSGLYNTISEGSGDREGRWQAFIDYSTFYTSVLSSPIKRRELGIKDQEVGLIENAIFKIIRKRDLNSKELEKQFGKVHAFVRSSNLKKYLENPAAKKHFINIAKNVSEDIPEPEKVDEQGNLYNSREIDEKWGVRNRTEIIGSLVQARIAINKQDERDKPIELLQDALNKLEHDNLKIENMGEDHYKTALKLTKEIKNRATELYKEIDDARYKSQKMPKMGKNF